jgi:zinc protease
MASDMFGTARRRRGALAAVLVLGLAATLAGQVTGQAARDIEAARVAPLDTIVPVDPLITVGELPNGLRYYVRTNQRPEKRAELRLVVRAGSFLEDEDQLGLAHLIEHVAIAEIRRFPPSATANGITSFEDTTYAISLATEQPDAIDSALAIMQQWASTVAFEPEIVQTQRSVVIEELRLKQGFATRLLPSLLRGTRFGDRLPSGRPEIIMKAPLPTIQRFYDEWYRPNVMAVVAVGDFDPKQVEALIRTRFGAIPRRLPGRSRPVESFSRLSGTSFTTVTDPEATATNVTMRHLVPPHDLATPGGYRASLVDRLALGILNRRLAEIARQPAPPFFAAGVGREALAGQIRASDDLSLTAVVTEDGVERGLEALARESTRLARLGFTADELDRDRQNLLRGADRMLADQASRDSANRAAEYIRNFLTREALPTTAYEFGLMQRFLPQITVEELNAFAAQSLAANRRTIIVTAPQKAALALPDSTKLEAVLAKVAESTLERPVASAAPRVLLPSVPAPGRTIRTAQREPGLTEIDFANGVKVVVKPTEIRADEVVFTAVRAGGTSLAGDDDYVAAVTATQVLSAGGLGALGPADLRDAMTGKVATVVPLIGEYQEGVTGGGSPKDLEALFQLIYLTFTQPRADPSAFELLRSQVKMLQANQTSSPAFQFSQTIAAALIQKHSRQPSNAIRDVARWDLQKSLAFYRARFGNANGFTFVFAGNVDAAVVQPLAERYLGSLPSTGRVETWQDRGVRTPPGIVTETIQRGVDPRSQVALVLSGPYQSTALNRATLRATAALVQGVLQSALREGLGATYSVTVGQDAETVPTGEYRIEIRWGCDPARTDSLTQLVLAELGRLPKMPPNLLNINGLRDQLIREARAASNQNAFIAAELSRAYLEGEDRVEALSAESVYAALDAKTVLDAAGRYLNLNRYVLVQLFPEKK